MTVKQVLKATAAAGFAAALLFAGAGKLQMAREAGEPNPQPVEDQKGKGGNGFIGTLVAQEAGEPQPVEDQKGKGGNGFIGTLVAQEAGEPQPVEDQKGKGGNGFIGTLVAREAEPGDDRGAREAQPGDDRRGKGTGFIQYIAA